MVKLVAELLRVLSVATGAGLLSQKAAASVSGVLDFAATLIEQGELGREKLVELKEEVTAMVAGGRNPSDEEWADLRERSDRAHQIIQDS